MRIIAGKHRSRKLETLEGNQTRPTLDQIKESFFNYTGPYFHDLVILDGFAGSGAIGLEYLSRYASKVYFVEKNKAAFEIVKQNVKTMGEMAQSVLINRDLREAISLIEERVDIIYLDPPYHFPGLSEMIDLCAKLCKASSVVYCESDINDIIESTEYFEVVSERCYRRTKITEFRLKGE